MGLFDKLTGRGLAGLKDKLEKATGVDLDGALNRLTGAAEQAVSRGAAGPAGRTPIKAAAQSDANAYFASILSEAFADYGVKAAVAASELGFDAATPAKPYDFTLTQDGVCRGVVMLTPHNRDNNAAFKNAKAAAQKAGVAFINFYTHYPNERNYVISRIHSFLG